MGLLRKTSSGSFYQKITQSWFGQKMHIRLLAHRGLWRTKADQNAPSALLQSLENGFGVETDIRDRSGVLVVSHDCPNISSPLLSSMWGTWQALATADRPLALNIKADGLAANFVDLVRGLAPGSFFFFDMSVPDMRLYLKLGLPVFTRQSDAEPEPAYYAQSKGVWLDALDGPWDASDAIRRHLDQGKDVAVVSEELHGRSEKAQWQMLRAFRDERRVLLCTDFPGKFLDFLQ